MIEALYIHIPFCVSRCSYCDFATSACDDDARMDAYIDALSLQLRRASRAGLLGNVKTIYIGGGTPSHLGTRRLNSLAYLISLSVNLENVIEYTCEVNPESLDERMVKDLFALGVDRLSIGAQSFDDDVLRAFSRAHNTSDIEATLEAAKARFENISLDLICGAPGQSMDSWLESLKAPIAKGIKHLSIYPLILEEGTPLSQSVDAGEVSVLSEDDQADMMLAAEQLLADAGFQRYEVASYALPGYESKHNTSYWSGIEYLGLGAGASSMLSLEDFDRACTANIFNAPTSFRAEARSAEVEKSRNESLETQHEISPPAPSGLGRNDVVSQQGDRVRVYASPDDIVFAESEGCPKVVIELLDPDEAQVEDLMLAMRKSCGVPVEQVDAVDGAQAVFDDLINRGLVAEQDDRYIPTQRGWLMGNEVYGAIWSLVTGKRQP